MGLIATMAALVLGLLVASASSTYNTQGSELQQLSANVILLDRLLGSYGPEAKEVRDQARDAIAAAHDRICSSSGVEATNLGAATRFIQQLQNLSPKTDAQRLLQSQAMQVAEGLLRTRLLMSEQRSGLTSSIFLVVLVFWICVLFLGFGLFARFNATV